MTSSLKWLWNTNTVQHGLEVDANYGPLELEW